MPNDVLTRAIDSVASGTHLTADHASAVLDEIMEGRASEVQTAAFLVALRAKGETVAELTGLARTMRRLASRSIRRATIWSTRPGPGRASTFNISTAAALVAAGAGCPVAKHGNRSNTSRSGSADLLEALGVPIELDPEAVARSIEEIGFGFMFAPRHHAAMKHVVPVRKELAVRTIFNFLGPLTNPAGATRQLLGVSDRRYQETIAEALLALGCERALVVSAEDGLDELSISGPTRVVEVATARTQEWFVAPADVGLAETPLERDRRRLARRTTPRWWKRSSTETKGRRATWSSSTPARRSSPAAPRTTWAGGMDRAREAIDRGAAKARPRQTLVTPHRAASLPDE